MADVTSGLTSAVFSSSSKMFIGGLSWQTSPGKNIRWFLGFVLCCAVCHAIVCCVAGLNAVRCTGRVASSLVI